MVKPPTAVPEVASDDLVEYNESDAPHWICFKDQVREVKLSKRTIELGDKEIDFLDRKDACRVKPEIIPAVVRRVCESERYRDQRVFATEFPEPPINEDGSIPPATPTSEWKWWTYAESYAEITNAARAFIKLGHQECDGVSILGFNAAPWAFSALGAMFAGGISAGIYPTDSAEQCSYKAQVSDSSVFVVDTFANYEKVSSKFEEIEYLKAIVVYKETDFVKEDMKLTRENGTEVRVLTWDMVQDLGRNDADADAELERRIANQVPGRCCALIFTSGTTGKPKGVMISHDNLVYQCKATINLFPEDLKKAKIPFALLSYLPLSHIAGLYLDVCSAFLTIGGNFCPDVSICFARSYDLKRGSIVDRLKVVRPTVFVGVPRVYEKVAEKMKANSPKSGFMANMLGFAKARLLQGQKSDQMGENGDKPYFHGVSQSIMKMVHKKLGLDRAVFTASAAAPMKQDVLEFWASLGFYVSEAYGMSENCGVATAGNKEFRDWGTVGFPLPGTETKVFKVDHEDFNLKTECPRAEHKAVVDEEFQGEVCMRGRHVMLGYLANPKLGEEHVEKLKKSNAEAIDNQGWLHSGDKGLVTQKGNLKITGRYKEIIIGSGGENIAPVPIEDDFKARCPAISNVMMFGDHKKFNVALISLTCVDATGQTPGTNVLASPAKDMTKATTLEEAAQDEEFIGMIVKALQETNSNEKVIHNNAFKIQKFTILPQDFSVETGELTATLKLKRSVAAKHYEEQIEAMYADTENVFVNTLP